MSTTLALQSMPVKKDTTSDTPDVSDVSAQASGAVTQSPLSVMSETAGAVAGPDHAGGAATIAHATVRLDTDGLGLGLVRVGYLFARWVADNAPEGRSDDLLALFSDEVLEAAGVRR